MCDLPLGDNGEEGAFGNNVVPLVLGLEDCIG